MIAAIKAEFRKLWTVRSTYMLCLLAFAALLLFAFYGDGIKAQAEDVANPLKMAGEVANAVMPLSLFSGIAVILLMTHEYRYNTIMYTLTSSNSRSKILLAKIIVATIFTAGFTLVFGTLSPLLSWLGLSLHGLHLGPQQIDVFSLLWRSLFFAWGMAMFALGFAVLMRNQIAVVVSFFMIPSTVESILSILLKQNAMYLPFTALGQVLQHHINEANQIALSYGRAAIVALVYLAVIWTVAWVLFLRRDAN